MTKRPEKEEFYKIYNANGNDKTTTADYFHVDLSSIYNWIEKYNADMETDFKVTEEKKFTEYMEIQKKSFQKPKQRKVNLSLKDECLIVCLSDTHLGSIYTDIDLLWKTLELIRDTPNVYAIFVGDIIDWTPTGPKDLVYDQVFPNPQDSRNWATQLVKTISKKLLAFVSGCHDKWSYKVTGGYIGEELSKYTLTNIFVPNALTLDLKLGDIEPYRIFMTHKMSSSKINPSHGMFRTARGKLAFDIGVTAHFHAPAIAQQNIRNKDVVVINCGTCKRVDTFAAGLGIPQQPLSIPGVYLNNKKRQIIPFFNWEDGIRYLNSD